MLTQRIELQRKLLPCKARSTSGPFILQELSEPHAATYRPLKRGMALLQDKKWLDAYDFFIAINADSASPNHPTNHTALAFSDLCQVKLGLQMPKTAAASKSKVAPTSTEPSPVRHLIQALSLDATASSTQTPRMLAAQRKLDAQTTGQALAFLMHPAAQKLPAVLSEEVTRVLHRRALALASLTSAPRGDGPSGSSKDLSAAEFDRWRAKAEGSSSLTKILELTGLESIKREMFNLYDQVSICLLVYS